MTEKKPKPFYRTAQDTLDDVGITQRQLTYWRREGLFNPELGSSSKVFTASDTAQLRFLKGLVVEMGLPIATVKTLIASLDEETSWLKPESDHTYIDTQRVRLVTPRDARGVLLAEAIYASSYRQLLEMFKAIAVELFNHCWMSSSGSHSVYEAKRREISNVLVQADLMYRARSGHNGLELRPSLSGDKDIGLEKIEGLMRARLANSVLQMVERVRELREPF